MFLSKVTLNPRSAGTYRLLSDVYRPHQFVLSAFPDQEEGGAGRVLYRVDTAEGGKRVFLLVVSEKEPDWELADERNKGLIACAQSRTFAPSFAAGRRLQFRLRANPTACLPRETPTEKRKTTRQSLWEPAPTGETDTQKQERLDRIEGKRREWLTERKSVQHGFAVESLQMEPEGMVSGTNPKGHRVSLDSVRYEGILRVTDAEAFGAALNEGIGSGKGFGFGLLSVLPL